MKKHLFDRALVIVAAALLTPCVRADSFTFQSGNFTDWTFGSYATGTASASMTVQATGGDPGAYLNTTTLSGAYLAVGYGLNPDSLTNQPVEGGSFSLSFDVQAGPGSYGQGQYVILMVEQGGVVFSSNILGITGVPVSWAAETFTGLLDASSFTNESGFGPAQPDFVSGVPTEFGFGGGNFTAGGSLTMYYDNFGLGADTPYTSSAIPEPGTLLLLGTGLAGAARWLRRRKAAYELTLDGN